VVAGASGLTALVTMTFAEPEPAAVAGVVEPYDVEVPYSNHQSVARPFGSTAPFRVAEVPVIALTEPGIAPGGAAAAPSTRVRAATSVQTVTKGRTCRITTNLFGAG